MTGNDERHVGVNYFIQESNGKSFEMWRRMIEAFGDDEEVVIDVIDVKKCDEIFAVLDELSARDTPKLRRILNKTSVFEAYGKPVASNDEE